jgi:hypothetical protein
MNRRPLCILLLAAGCRPDAGSPNYPNPGEWDPTEGDPDFYGDDPYEDGDQRLSIGAFYEGGASEEVPINDLDTHFYVYESTFTAGVSDDRIEGYVSTSLEHAGGPWWGGGVHWDQARDLSSWDTLHLSVKSRSADMGAMTIGMTGGGTEGRVALADLGFVADGTWQTLNVPLQHFVDGGADMGSVTVPFLFGGQAAPAGDSVLIDDLYFTVRGTGVEEPDFLPGTVPYEEGDERLSFGAFYEGDASEAWEIDNETRAFYIFDDTFSVATSDDRTEGFVSDVLTAGSVGWMGGGLFVVDPGDGGTYVADLSAYDTLHVALKSTDAAMANTTIAMNGGAEVALSVSDYGFAPDGEWHDVTIPLTDFVAAGVQLDQIVAGFIIGCTPVAAGESIMVDDLYLTNTGIGVEEPELLPGNNPYEAGDTRLSIGAFYEGDASTAWSLDDPGKDFFIYDSTFTVQSSTDRVEGIQADALVAGGAGWMGGGIHVDPAEDLSAYDTLRVSLKSSDAGLSGVTIGMNGVSEVRVGMADYGFSADGTWHDLVIPLSDLEAEGVDLTQVSVAMLLIAEGVTSGDTLLIDDLYFTGGE